MKVKVVFILAVLLLAGSACFSQVTFSERPSDYRLYPRLTNDSSIVTIAGLVTDSNFHFITYTMYKNEVLVDSISDSLFFNGDNASFIHEFSIHAEKSNYKICMYVIGDSIVEILKADSICSGDIYLIYGQSNASASANGPGTDLQHTWVRSFGTENSDDSICYFDTSWGLGVGDSYNEHLSIGEWAIRLGRIIADSTRIPVCFLNGSHNGCRIVTNLPSTDHNDIHTIYGRLLYRTEKAGVEQHIKGIFWYQGESDSDTACFEYAVHFNELFDAWQQDFPGLQRVYIIQTRPGCINTTNPVFHQKLREIQRQLSESDPHISLVPTVGLPLFDGCHFTTVGYQNLGRLIYNMLCEDLYGNPKPSGNRPPGIKDVLYSGNDNTVISIVFDQQVLWPSPFNGYDLKDYIYLNSSATVISGWQSGDTINLQLSASTNAYKITYLPGINYTGTTDTYMGPWLLNVNGYGAPSFYELPVKNTLLVTAAALELKCRGDSILFTTKPLNQTAQWYFNGQPIPGEVNTSFFAKNAGDYYVIMTDVDSLSLMSNTVTITSEVVPVPAISSSSVQFSFCNGSSFTLQCNNTAASYQWYRDGIKINNSTAANLNIVSPGNYSVVVQQVNGCIDSSAVQPVTRHNLPSAAIVVTNQFDDCSDTMVILTTNRVAGNYYQWRNNQSAIPAANKNIYHTKSAGLYSVTVTNSDGCSFTTGFKHIPLANTFASYSPSGPTSFCKGNSVLFSAAGANGYIYQWLKDNLPISGAKSNSYQASTSGKYNLMVINADGCKSIAQATTVVSMDCEIQRMAENEDEGFKLYPNPFSDQLFIYRFPVDEPFKQFSATLFDVNGHIVIETAETEASVFELKLNTKTLANGLFFYRVNINGNYFTGKVLKQ